MRFKTLRWLSSSFLATGALFACSATTGAGPERSAVTGAYSLAEFTLTRGAVVQDLVAEGARLEITLTSDGLTTGSLDIPGGNEDGSDLSSDMAGTWRMDGNTIHFQQEADTFVRDMEFTVSDGELNGTLAGQALLRVRLSRR